MVYIQILNVLLFTFLNLYVCIFCKQHKVLVLKWEIFSICTGYSYGCLILLSTILSFVFIKYFYLFDYIFLLDYYFYIVINYPEYYKMHYLFMCTVIQHFFHMLRMIESYKNLITFSSLVFLNIIGAINFICTFT